MAPLARANLMAFSPPPLAADPVAIGQGFS